MFEGRKARILIIDDSLINRKKLRMAVESLGHDTEVAVDGADGLATARRGEFDTVLLDLMMPQMDGFGFLAQMKSDASLRDLPVIVISDLENTTDAVASAIELGAEDFLPKRLDPAILFARLNACLRKKHFRDQELAYFKRVEVLTDAAEKVQTGRFDDTSLNLEKEALVDDPIGRLASVFQGMAREIHVREVKLLRRIQTLQASFILLLSGALIGLMPAMSRLAFSQGSNPFGLAAWVDLIAAACFLLLLLFRRNLPQLSRSDLGFFIAWAFFVGILQHMIIFILAEHFEATFLTMMLALQSLTVFVFAAGTGMEHASVRRILGLMIGLAGIGIALYQRLANGIWDQNLWILASLSVPIIYAVETLVLSARRPKHVDPVTSIGLMFFFSAVFAVPLAVATGNFIPVSELISPLGSIVVLLTVIAIVSNVSFLYLLMFAGPVFGSQTAYVQALSGIVCGVLLLGETMSALAWIAMLLVLVGMFLVESKASDEPITIKRDFLRSQRSANV